MLFFKKKASAQQPEQSVLKGFIVKYKLLRDSDMELIVYSCDKTGKEIYDAYMAGVYVTAKIDGVDYHIETAEYNADKDEYYFKYRTEMLDKDFNIFCIKITHNPTAVCVMGESAHVIDIHPLAIESDNDYKEE